MNKELEALWRAMLCLIDGNRDIETENALETIEEALKRNEPMKLKTKRVKVSIDDYRIDDYCPTCDEGLYATSNYCPHCGQKLDWSDDEIELKRKDLQKENK